MRAARPRNPREKNKRAAQDDVEDGAQRRAPSASPRVSPAFVPDVAA
jgi:hypothetical protein